MKSIVLSESKPTLKKSLHKITQGSGQCISKKNCDSVECNESNKFSNTDFLDTKLNSSSYNIKCKGILPN